MTPAPTLLVFTRGPERDARRRRLLPERDAPLTGHLFAVCLAQALAAGRANRCRLAVSSPAPIELPDDVEPIGQEGRGFAERLGGALAATRPAGAWLVVGSDVPGLRETHVARALAALRADPAVVVVGPSPDGGFYLLAARQPLGDLLAEVRWCGRAALASLRRAARRRALRLVLLEPLADLDRPSDLERFAATASLGAVWSLLRDAVAALLVARRRACAFVSPTALELLPLRRAAGRAPPRRLVR